MCRVPVTVPLTVALVVRICGVTCRTVLVELSLMTCLTMVYLLPDTLMLSSVLMPVPERFEKATSHPTSIPTGYLNSPLLIGEPSAPPVSVNVDVSVPAAPFAMTNWNEPPKPAGSSSSVS